LETDLLYISSNTINGSLNIPNSNFVGINDSQTLTNKTMDYNLNTFENFPVFGSTQYFFNRSIASSYGYAEMTTTPVQTAQTSITAVGSGIQQLKGLNCSGFITPVGIPNLTYLNPGIWTFSMHIAMSNSTGTPTIYPALYKVSDLGVETLISDGSLAPTPINQGTSVYDYVDNLAIPYTVMDRNDRFVVKFFAQNLGARTMTMYFEDNTISYAESSVATVNAIQSINGLYPTAQLIKVGNSGTEPNVVSIGASHTINIPRASVSNSGIITIGTQSFSGNKTFTNNVNINGSLNASIPKASLPATVVYTTDTQTLTNKTISTSTNSITNASATDSGIVNIGTQSFAGDKTFSGTLTGSSLVRFTNTADVSGLGSAPVVLSGGASIAKSLVVGATVEAVSRINTSSTVEATTYTDPNASMRTLGGIAISKTCNTGNLKVNLSSVVVGLFNSTNTTESTSTTSNSAIKTAGGISCAKNMYADSVFGKNKLTDYYVIMLENTSTQTVPKSTYVNASFNTVAKNPSSMTTYTGTTEDGFVLNQTGYWLITAHVMIPVADTNPAYMYGFITRVGSDYDRVMGQSITSFNGGSSTEGYSITYTGLRYYNSGQRLSFTLNVECTPASVVIGSRGNLGTKTSLSAQFMGF